MAFATIQITQGATVGGGGESVIGLVPGTDITLTDSGGAGATSYLWEILQWPAPDAVAPTLVNSTNQVCTVQAGAGLTDGVYIVRLTRDDPADGVSADTKFFAVADDDGLSLPVAGMNRTMSNVLGSSEAQKAGWFGSTAGGTNVFLDAYLRLRRAREGLSKVSSNDTTFLHLENKVAVGVGISKQTLNDGASEQVELSSLLETILTPTLITADQDDYTPTGFGPAGVLRLSTNASRTITGFGTATEQPIKHLVNVGSNDLVLSHQNSNSTAANRITTPDGQNFTISPNGTTALWYDTTSLTWRILDYSSGGNGGAVAESFISPTALAANTDDYGPTDWQTATVVRLSTNGSDYDITGFVAPTGDAVRKTLINVDSTSTITLKNEDSNSTATNRITTSPGTGFAMLPEDAVEILYDPTSERWRTV